MKVVLRSRTTGEVLWEQLCPSNANWLSPSAFYLLNGVPDWVEYAELWSEGMLLVRSGPFGMVNVQQYSTQSTPSEVFIVLDEPKVPMSPAWVSVLRYSCDWASTAQDEQTAARKVTNALHLWGTYNGGYLAFTEDSTDSGEVFYCTDYIRLVASLDKRARLE